jgi:shikimate dehydrogenase
MHRAGYTELGLDYVYVPFAVKDLEGALHGMRALGIRGFGVSMPFKLEVVPLLDHVDDLAKRIGAVNTIVNDDGLLSGFNTDASGAVRALSEAVADLSGKRVCVIGAGGAARAVAFGLATEGMRVHCVYRTISRAQQLATEVSHAVAAEVTSGGLEDLSELESFDVVVNASSAGMAEYGGESLVPEDAIRRGLVVMDIVYKPIRTALIECAERRGAKVVHGGRMLLHQACGQFELYTGRTAPVRAMDDALRAALGS